MRHHILAAVLHLAVFNPNTGQEPPFGAKLETIISWVAWIACAACVAGVLIVASQMALKHQRGEAGQHATGLGIVLLACIIIATASGIVGTLT